MICLSYNKGTIFGGACMKDNIYLVVASDDNYAQHAAITLLSAYAKCSVPECLQCFILDGGISPAKKDKITLTITSCGGKVSFLQVDTNKYKNLYTSFQYTPAVYYRLDLANVLNENISKCIYVDCDLIFMDDIRKIWDIDLEGHPIGAIEDVGLMTSKKGLAEKAQTLGLQPKQKYFNSGVVVMDLKLWRANRLAEAAIKLANSSHFASHDQDVLNKLFLGNWKEIDLRWNVTPPITYLYPKILFSTQYRVKSLAARRNPGILHYAGRYKAWEFAEHKGFNEEYYALLKQSAFSDANMPQLSKQNIDRNFTKELLRLRMADMLSNTL